MTFEARSTASVASGIPQVSPSGLAGKVVSPVARSQLMRSTQSASFVEATRATPFVHAMTVTFLIVRPFSGLTIWSVSVML